MNDKLAQMVIISPKIDKDNISNIWKEIINNWSEFRECLCNKNTRMKMMTQMKLSSFMINDSSKLTYKLISSKKELVIYLWSLGLPQWLRQRFWRIVIGNTLDICESFYESLKVSVEPLQETVSSKMIHDIEKVGKYYNEYIVDKHSSYNEDIYDIVSLFVSFRIDIQYEKYLVYISTVCYLNSDSVYNAFVLFSNFIISSGLLKLVSDAKEMKMAVNFINNILQQYYKELYSCLIDKWNIPIELKLQKWFSKLYTKYFPYEIIIRVWDNYIIKGNIYIYEVAIGIFGLLKKHIMNSSDLKEVIKMLDTFPSHLYTEEELFTEINHINIDENYYETFENYTIGTEKGELFKNI